MACMAEEVSTFLWTEGGQDASHRKLLWSKATVVNVAEKSEQDSTGMIERGVRGSYCSGVMLC
jgi:hypothetical protein